MPEVVEIWGEWTKGKRSHKGQPLPPDQMPQPDRVVSLVAPSAIDSAIGARSRAERTRFLRQLRDEGRIYCDKNGKLTQSLRRGSHGLRSAYVFRCEAVQIPQVPRESGQSTASQDGSSRGGIRQILEI
jgi:hypothetical protein